MIYTPSPILFFIFASALLACAIACAIAKTDRSAIFFMTGAMTSAAALVFLLDIPFTAEITIAAAGISGFAMLIAANRKSHGAAQISNTCAQSTINKPAAVTSLVLFAILAGAILDSNFIDTAQILSLGPQTYLNAETISSTKEMGVRLISTFIYPFIMAALLIMAAIFSFITVLNPNQKTTSASDNEPGEPPVDEPAEKSAKGTAEDPAEAPAEEHASESSEKPAEESAEKPAEESAEESDDAHAELSAEAQACESDGEPKGAEI